MFLDVQDLESVVNLCLIVYGGWKVRAYVMQHSTATAVLRMCQSGSRAAVQRLRAHYRSNKPFWWFMPVYIAWTVAWSVVQGPGSTVNDMTQQTMIRLSLPFIAFIVLRWTVSCAWARLLKAIR